MLNQSVLSKFRIPTYLDSTIFLMGILYRVIVISV
jgi:hypothetical protein